VACSASTCCKVRRSRCLVCWFLSHTGSTLYYLNCFKKSSLPKLAVACELMSTAISASCPTSFELTCFALSSLLCETFLSLALKSFSCFETMVIKFLIWSASNSALSCAFWLSLSMSLSATLISPSGMAESALFISLITACFS